MVLIIVLFWGNRFCKDSIMAVEGRKKLNVQRLLDAEEDGLKSPSDSEALYDLDLTLQERLCSQQ